MSNIDTVRVGGTDYAIEDPTKANASQIATIESGATASAAHVAGEFIYHSGTLYVVTAPISAGDTLTVGTNIQATTVGSELKTIKTDLSDYHVVPSRNKVPNNKATKTVNNVTFTVNEDLSVTINTGSGGASADAYFIMVDATEDVPLAQGDYVISGCTGGSDSTFRLYLQERNADNTGWGTVYPCYDGAVNYTRSNSYRYVWAIRVKSGATVTNKTIYPMISTAADYATDPSYEPYWVCMRDGKLDIADYARTGAVNLFKMTAQSTTQSPISSVINLDAQTATLSATAESTRKWISLSGNFKLPQGRYFLSGCPKRTGVTCQLLLRDDPQDTFVVQDFGDGGVWFDVDATIAAKNLIMIIGVSCTAAFSNLVFRPMIATNDKMPFVPFVMTNKELTDAIRYTIANFPTTTGSSYYLHKVGRLGILTMVAVLSGVTADTWTLVGTIASGARPIAAYFFACAVADTNNVVQGLLETDGSIKIKAHTGGSLNIRASVAYVIA